MIKAGNIEIELPGGFALHIADLHIRRGEVFALIGPNGAGKTTLLNALGLLQPVRSGRLEIAGRDARLGQNALALRRAMSYVFSRPYLAAGSVYDNVLLPLRFRGRSDAGAADRMLELFKIPHLKHRDAARLSHGERHRVAMARALVTAPELLLLDEPFSSLDARAREAITADLAAVLRASGATAVLVTQNQEEALALADTLGVLCNGRLLQSGPPAEIYSRPASPEVAEFVGAETLVPGLVKSSADNLCAVDCGGRELAVVAPCAPGDRVLVCVRPEAVSVAREPEASSARNHFKGRIISAEPWRLEYKLAIDCGFTLIAAVTKRSVDALELKPGAEVYASFKATAAHLIKR